MIRLALAAVLPLLAACTVENELPLLDLSDTAGPEEIDRIAAGEEPAGHYLFGFDLRNGPTEDARQYLPLLTYLERTTGHRFELRFSHNADELVEALANDRIQFAAIGAGSYLAARQRGQVVPLVRGVNREDEPGYRSYLVAAPDSPLQSIADLRGHRLAFGSRTSTQGYWIPRIMLHRAGVDLADLSGYFFTGSHRACAEAVIAGRAGACGLQDTLARELVREGALKTLAVSEVYPSSGIFASQAVPDDIRQSVRSALARFDPRGRDAAGLYHWDRTEMAGGFVPASAADYRPLLVWAQRLQLLQTREGQPCN